MNNLSREEQIALIYDKWQKMTITSDPMFGLVMPCQILKQNRLSS